MDEKVEGGKPEETVETPVTGEARGETPGQAAATPPPPGPPPGQPYYNRPVGRKDWLLIALVAVSTIAVLLLAATIVLAVTHGRDGGRRGQMMQRFEKSGNCPGCDENGNDNSARPFRRMQRGLPLPQEPNTTPPQSTPSVPVPQQPTQ